MLEILRLILLTFITLQNAVFAKFPDLRSFALANVASVDVRDALYKHFGSLR